MKSELTGSDSVRIPTPREGVATRVRRYNEDRAVIIHPADFERFEFLESLLTEVSTLPELRPSEAADRVYVEESTPGEAITDAESVRQIFS